MAHTQNHIETLGGNQGAFEQFVQQRLRQAVRVALISVLEEEVSVFIGALPYERTQQRCDQRNGHYTRDLEACLTFYAFPKGALEDDPHQQCDGAARRLGQASLA